MRGEGGQAGLGEPGGDLGIGEAEPRMGVAGAQLLALMRAEIDDEQAPARGQQAGGLGDGGGGLQGVMQDLVDDDEIGGAVWQRQRIHIALADIDMRQPGGGEFDAREAQHLGAAVQAGGLGGARGE